MFRRENLKTLDELDDRLNLRRRESLLVNEVLRKGELSPDSRWRLAEVFEHNHHRALAEGLYLGVPERFSRSLALTRGDLEALARYEAEAFLADEAPKAKPAELSFVEFGHSPRSCSQRTRSIFYKPSSQLLSTSSNVAAHISPRLPLSLTSLSRPFDTSPLTLKGRSAAAAVAMAIPLSTRTPRGCDATLETQGQRP